MFLKSKTCWNRMEQIDFKRPTCYECDKKKKKKKITWYKYANINKVIRKPLILKSMHFEKEMALFTFSLGCRRKTRENLKRPAPPTHCLLHWGGASLTLRSMHVSPVQTPSFSVERRGQRQTRRRHPPPPTRESSAQKMPFKNLHRRRRAPETKWDLPPRRQRIQRARTHKRTTPLIRHRRLSNRPAAPEGRWVRVDRCVWRGRR